MTKKSKIYGSLVVLWGSAFPVMVFSAGLSAHYFGAYLPDFASLMRSDPVHFTLSILLTLFTFLLFLAYMVATRYELDVLYRYLGDVIPMPQLKPKIYFITFGLAIVFGVLIAFSRSLLAYSVVIVTYNLFDLWGSWEVAKTIGPPLKKKLHIPKHDYLGQHVQADGAEIRGLHIIRAFYFVNPTLPRIATMMFVDWIVVCLALAYFFTNQDVLRTCGYVLLLFNITIAELIIIRWRRRSIYKLAHAGWTSGHRQPAA